jgi:hypothetical protein
MTQCINQVLAQLYVNYTFDDCTPELSRKVSLYIMDVEGWV